ncbi:MAG: DJ-1/PfpI family protein [Bacteroidaceae bacterium]|nr:DJ-1/PfpI family protein [Bacteroidaceae bacterium]
MIYAFLADGFEEVEALAVVDVCRRAGLEVNMVSIMPSDMVVGAHGIKVMADSMFADNDYSNADLLFLPGGMPGASNLDEHEGVSKALMAQNAAGKPIAAICAAPFVLGKRGLLKGIKCTCYPGFEGQLEGANHTGALVEKDGLFMTGKGPGAALALGYMIVDHFCGSEVAEGLMKGMMYK